MPSTIDPFIRLLDTIGVVDVVLPFVLVFTLIYAVLEKTKVLGVEKGHPYHRVNSVVAVIIALFVVGAANLLGIVTTIVTYTGLLAIIVIAFAMLFGLFGVEHLPQSKAWNTVFFIIFMLMSIYVFQQLGFDDLVIGAFVLFLIILFVIKFWFREPVHQHSGQPAVNANPSNRNKIPTSPKDAAERAAPQHKRPETVTGLGEFEDIPIEGQER